MSTPAEIDGIPLLLAPPVAGRCAGGLTFRVGHADETLATSGITHLTEHLALHFSDPTKLHSNGMTGPNTTMFHISGDIDDVVGFLNQVAAALRTPPMARLETEKSVLHTEAARRGGAADGLHTWRFGARDYGLASFAELGLHRITADEVAAWTARWFTTGNAVVWLAADQVPAGLDLSLPAGERMPTPRIDPWLPPGPAYYSGPDRVVAGSALIRRSTAGRVFSSVLEQALFRELRQVGGYSYSPSASYEPLDGSMAMLYAAADSLPDKQDAVVGGFVDVLAGLRLGAISEQDVASAVANARKTLDHPDLATLRLPAEASDLLLGHDRLSDEQLRAELDAVDEEAVRAIAVEAHATTLLQVPGRGVDWAGYAEAPGRNDVSVPGTAYAFVEESDCTIRVGDDGICVLSPRGVTGVRWESAVAVTVYPDGARTVVGSDGFQVHVEPNLLVGDTGELVAAIDAGAPAVAVPMPARDPDRIPPVPTPEAPGPRAEPSGSGEPTGPRWAQVLAPIIGFLALASLGLFLWGVLQQTTDGGTASEDWSRVLGRGVRAAVLGLVYWWLHGKARGPRPA